MADLKRRPEDDELIEVLGPDVVDLILEEVHRVNHRRGGELTAVLPIGRDGRVDASKARVTAWRWARAPQRK